MKRHLLLFPTAETAGNKTDKPDAKVEDKPGDKPADKPSDKPEDKPTAEELKKRQGEALARSRGKKPESKKEEKPADKKPEAKEDKPADKPDDKKEDKAEDKPVEKKEDKPEVKPPAARRERVEVPPPIDRQPKHQADKEPEFKTTMELSPAEKRKLKVIQEMESEDSMPKGSAQKMLKFWEKEFEYIKAWQAQNPGKEFDDTAEEHQPFYESNEVTYDPDSYEIARDNLVRKEAKGEIESEQTKKDEQTKRYDSLKTSDKNFVSKANDDVVKMIKMADPELSKLLGENGLSKEGYEAMVKKDPVATEIIRENSEELATLLVELDRLTEFGDIYPSQIGKAVGLQVSGKRIYPHALLMDFTTSLEREMLAMPPEQTMRGSKRLVAVNDFNDAVDEIVKGQGDNTAKQAKLDSLTKRYYTLDDQDFRTGLIASYAATSKAEVEKFGKRVGLRTPKKDEKEADKAPDGEKKDEKAEENEVEKDEPRRERKQSPSTASASDAVDSGKKPDMTTTDAAKNAVLRSRGG